ncbi:glycosyltransferase family 4 protein [Amycolatopsis alba]|uniref:Glycosyltransferase n=1 Tax=Amycolatopsis alba DSM 44262 TaxID=1125972 RepID=A0A229RCB0_AMYAL|nr:glycosyltransferase family 4 protein [Amycolatopsis alba]OXM44129.1 glycosyltransferase [Amycolatopsis alba DSM 44262]
MSSAPPLTVAFVLASYTPNAPAGIERATAALAHGLRQLGHRSLILTAAPIDTPDDTVMRLRSVGVTFPCDDGELRDAISTHGQDALLAAELCEVYRRHRVDVAVYTDGLWGLGRAAPISRARTVLAMHVVGHDQDLEPALARADLVIAPSQVVLDQAHARVYDTGGWLVVPNALLHTAPLPSDSRREALRRHGPIRVLARLGAEKNVRALLDAGRLVDRTVEVIVGEAGFEAAIGDQAAELDQCRYSAAHLALGTVHGGGLGWDRVPAWLAQAAVVIVPSLRETFGLVALEAMSVGTPVVAFDVGNLPSLVGTGDGSGGVIIPRSWGEHGLWRAAEQLLADPVRYAHLSRAAYYRSRDYLPTTVAETFVKAVR